MALTTDQLASARLYLSDPGSSAIQAILLTGAGGGTWTATFGGQTTAALAYNAAASVVENALCALSSIGVGNLTVNNTAPYEVYFEGTLGETAQANITVDGTLLTPAGASIVVSKVASGGQFAFSDSDLNLLYGDASSDFWLMIAYAFRVLAADLSRLNDYTAGQSQEKASQRYAHVLEMADLYERWARAGKQLQLASMVPEPPRIKAIPWRVGSTATGLAYEPPYGAWRRRGWGGW